MGRIVEEVLHVVPEFFFGEYFSEVRWETLQNTAVTVATESIASNIIRAGLIGRCWLPSEDCDSNA